MRKSGCHVTELNGGLANEIVVEKQSTRYECFGKWSTRADRQEPGFEVESKKKLAWSLNLLE
jgi:hypothetical protein